MEEKLEYYTIRPSLKQYYGKKVDENTIFDEVIKEKGLKITQHFEDLTLTTKINKKTKSDENMPFDIVEKSMTSLKVPTGTILIWTDEGFVVPQYQMTTLTELTDEINDVKNIYKESKV